MGGSAAAFATAVAVPIVRFVEPPAHPDEGPVTVGRLEDFPVASAKTVMVHDRPVLVIHTPDGEIRAFSALCTHLQCVVGYSAERNRIECPCHRGEFAIDGRNLAGPPTRPLDELTVTIEEGSVVVSVA